MSNSNNGSIWPIVWIVLGLAVVLQMIAGNNSSSTTSTATPADTGSFEYRYAKERFKQEGFNNSDADTAARAVIKFHEAQKARGQ
jgi:hypothetical protein